MCSPTIFLAEENVLLKAKTKLVLHRGNSFKELVEAFVQNFIDLNNIYIGTDLLIWDMIFVRTNEKVFALDLGLPTYFNFTYLILRYC